MLDVLNMHINRHFSNNTHTPPSHTWSRLCILSTPTISWHTQQLLLVYLKGLKLTDTIHVFFLSLYAVPSTVTAQRSNLLRFLDLNSIWWKYNGNKTGICGPCTFEWCSIKKKHKFGIQENWKAMEILTIVSQKNQEELPLHKPQENGLKSSLFHPTWGQELPWCGPNMGENNEGYWSVICDIMILGKWSLSSVDYNDYFLALFSSCSGTCRSPGIWWVYTSLS